MPVLWRSETFDATIASLKGAARGSVGVITDFDRTLTQSKAVECHILVASSPLLEEPWRADVSELVEASRLPPEQTPSHLSGVDWWKRYNTLVEKHRIQDDDIKRAVDDHPLSLFRPGVEGFHRKCAESDVPLVVISAGIHNVVHHVYRKEFADLPLPHIIANKIDDASVSHPQEPITSRSKGEALRHACEKVTAALHTKPITIVIGDKPNDSTAADLHPRRDCPESPSRTIKIGIINDVSRWAQFLESFDIVLDGRSQECCPFDFINEHVLSPLTDTHACHRDPTAADTLQQ